MPFLVGSTVIISSEISFLMFVRFSSKQATGKVKSQLMMSQSSMVTVQCKINVRDNNAACILNISITLVFVFNLTTLFDFFFTFVEYYAKNNIGQRCYYFGFLLISSINVNIFTINDTTFAMVQCLFNIVNMFVSNTKIAEIYD